MVLYGYTSFLLPWPYRACELPEFANKMDSDPNYHRNTRQDYNYVSHRSRFEEWGHYYISSCPDPTGIAGCHNTLRRR